MVIDQDDVLGSWRKWHLVFDLAVRIETLEMGKVSIGTNEIPNLQDKIFEEHKLLGLCSSIGDEGRSTLLSTSISLDSEEVSYERAIRALEKRYKCEQRLFVRTEKLVNVKQAQREDSICF